MARDPIPGGTWYQRYVLNDHVYLVKDVAPIPQNYYAWTITDDTDEFAGGTVYTLSETPEAGDAIFDANGNVIGDYDDNFYVNGYGYHLNQALTSYSSANNSIEVDGTTTSVRIHLKYQRPTGGAYDVPNITNVYFGWTSYSLMRPPAFTIDPNNNNTYYLYLPTGKSSKITASSDGSSYYAYIMVDDVVVADAASVASYTFTPTTPIEVGVCKAIEKT